MLNFDISAGLYNIFSYFVCSCLSCPFWGLTRVQKYPLCPLPDNEFHPCFLHSGTHIPLCYKWRVCVLQSRFLRWLFLSSPSGFWRHLHRAEAYNSHHLGVCWQGLHLCLCNWDAAQMDSLWIQGLLHQCLVLAGLPHRWCTLQLPGASHFNRGPFWYCTENKMIICLC